MAFALTLMSLPATPLIPPSPVHGLASPILLRAPARSLDSEQDHGLPVPSSRTQGNLTSRRVASRGVRDGLAGLSQAPSPFGSQLGADPIPSCIPRPSFTRRSPHSPSSSSSYFVVASSPRSRSSSAASNSSWTDASLSSTQEPASWPDPEYVYDKILETCDSVKSLVLQCKDKAMENLTAGGVKSGHVVAVEIGVLLMLCYRPKWIFEVAIGTVRVLRQPFGLFQKTLYHSVIQARR